MKSRRSLGALGVMAAMLLLAMPAMAQGGSLVAAEWGVPGRRVDVSPAVRSYMHEGILRIEVSRQVLGIDPAPGQVKDLMIRIRHWDGDVQEYVFPEHAMVNLELDPDAGFDFHERGLHIMRAYYGGEGHFVNVTERLRQVKEGNHLFIHVDNRNLGIDPDPYVHKALRVLYWYDGQRRNVVVPERGDLRLP